MAQAILIWAILVQVIWLSMTAKNHRGALAAATAAEAIEILVHFARADTHAAHEASKIATTLAFAQRAEVDKKRKQLLFDDDAIQNYKAAKAASKPVEAASQIAHNVYVKSKEAFRATCMLAKDFTKEAATKAYIA